jgi:predicted MFS family arabinose efflux permease
MLCPTLVVVLLLTHALQPWIVSALSLVIGITDALSMPSFQSIVPSIVEHRQIASGLELNSTQFNLSRILGPALAGVLITSMGVIACYVASAVSYLPFILIALWILPPRDLVVSAEDAIGFHHMFTGVRGIMQDYHLRGALLTVMATSLLCGPLLTFCPVLVKSGFHGDAAQFSVAIGAFGLGGLLGATCLRSVDERRDRRRLSSWFAAAFGLVVILATLTPWFWSLPVLLLLAGLSMTVSNTSANTLLLTTADPHLRGQTVSLYMLAMRGRLALGSLLTGISVSVLGVREALMLNGALALLAHLVIRRLWLLSPERDRRHERYVMEGDFVFRGTICASNGSP